MTVIERASITWTRFVSDPSEKNYRLTYAAYMALYISNPGVHQLLLETVEREAERVRAGTYRWVPR